MTVLATVICETEKPARVYGNRGKYEFAACPRVGDELLLRYAGLRTDVFVVRRVSHVPRMPDESALQAEELRHYGEVADDCPLNITVAFLRSRPD